MRRCVSEGSRVHGNGGGDDTTIRSNAELRDKGKAGFEFDFVKKCEEKRKEECKEQDVG